MNTSLRKLAGKGQHTAVCVLAGLAAVICLAAFVLSLARGGKEEASYYTVGMEEGDRAYVEVSFLSEYFASFDVNEDDKLYFALDEEMYPYIVCISDKEIEAYRDIQAWTFGETEIEPAKIRAEGVLVPIDDEIIDLAVDEFNWFMDTDIITEDNFTEYFGDFYVDTAVGEVSSTPYVLCLIAIAAAAVLVIMLRQRARVKAVSDAELGRLEPTGEAAAVDAELRDIRTQHYRRLKVYLTAGYAVSYGNGLTVTPLHTVARIYGVCAEKRYGLVFCDQYGAEREAVKSDSLSAKDLEELRSLVKEITGRQPGIACGVGGGAAEGEVDLLKVPDFFRRSAPASAAEQSGFDLDGTGQRTNYLMGTLGALIGALIGGVLWFVVGNMGFIAGIVGFVIISLSASGFTKGAKRMTKGGALIVVLISVLTIFAANYALYAWIVVRELNGRLTLGEALVRLPALMEQYDVTGEFVRDILIGYGLTLLAGFSTIAALFKRQR